MAAPIALFTLADLESALTGEKVRELLGTKGVAEADNPKVKLVIESATGFVFGKIQIAVKLKSIDELWDSTWGDRDKGEIRRLAISAGMYYAHFYGQKGEEIPESVVDELERIEKRCTEIAEHYATLGNDPPAESSTQHDEIFSPGAGHTYPGQPRHNWSGF
ncbi:MAG: hypothetical protein E6Q97_36350 [Desulfurellales bacterium]|nr:MAG: hypothetical protein E6Q97_36350 [Desulfurellales bacterium]